MSEQRHDVSERRARDNSDEPSLEWLAELSSDADDPELQPVDPSVTQGFAAILEEDDDAPQDPAEPPAPAAAEPSGPAPVPPAGPAQGPAPVPGGDPAAGEFARALAEEQSGAVPGTVGADPTVTMPDPNGAPVSSRTGGFPALGTGPLPRVAPATGGFPAVGPGTGPQPAVGQGPGPFDGGPGTGPQPPVGPNTGGFPAVGPGTGPQPAVGQGPGPFDGGPGTGPQPPVGPNTGGFPAVGPGTGPQPAVGQGHGPFGEHSPGTGGFPAVGPGTGPQPPVSPNTGGFPAVGPGTGPQPAAGQGPGHGTGGFPAVGPGTGGFPAVGPGTGPQPAVGPGPEQQYSGADALFAMGTGASPSGDGLPHVEFPPGTGLQGVVMGRGAGTSGGGFDEPDEAPRYPASPTTGSFPAIGTGTGPQASLNPDSDPFPPLGQSGTGPQPAAGGGTGPQDAVSPEPAPAPGEGGEPFPAVEPGPGTGLQPALGAGPRPEIPQGTDTVAVAAATPDRPQPYVELGMKDDEYRRVREILGRRPTSAELAIYSVMWSEHCSYKSSKVHLRQFGDKAPQTDALLVGMGENAGVVDVGQGWAVTFKVESHNHPSYVEPYQGAATGVGGIVRDIMSMGARPIAVMDSLRFGPADAPDTQRVLPGVVAGVGGYGNSLGLPNIGGETVFDACYAQNPLVNALCVGVMKHDDIQRAVAPGPGNKVILFGAGTGPDGIGGASVLASATFDDESQQKRPSVQVGDPFMEKLLIECCLELFREDLVVGVQDLGAAGVSCATTELAAAGTGGMDVELDAVPLRDATLRPEEILMSESQERMMAVVTPENVDRFMQICARWEIPATVIGTVTDTGRLVMRWQGETIVDIPPGTAADEGPVYRRPLEPPHDLGALQADTPGRLTRPSTGDELRRTVLWLAGSPNLAGKTWVTSQYDRYVLGNTVLAQPENAGVVRIDDESGLGIALSLDGNGRYTRLDPYSGAQLALSEAYRNVAATGARPLAVTNCLNFGSPEDPGVMWQFQQAVTGLADACEYLGVPVTGGNVSFYNQTGSTPINPTPVIGVLGVHEDVRRRVNMSLTTDGATIALLGETREEFGGSEWAHVVYGHLGGLPPLVDLAAERALANVLQLAVRDGLVTTVHDLSDGGLSQALVESCLRGGLGARVTLHGDPFVQLFSESVARAMVAILPGAEAKVAALCEAHGVPVAQLGVAGGDALSVTVAGQDELFSIPLHELRESHERMLPSYAD